MEEKKFLTPSAACYLNESIWAIRNKDSLLMRIDLLSQKVMECYRISGIDFARRKSWNDKLIPYQNKIIFCPDYCSDIFIYNIDSKTSCELTKYPKGLNFTMNPVLLHMNKLLFFPYDSTDLFVYHIDGDTWEKKTLFREKIKLKRNASVINDKVLLLIEDTNRICIVNLENYSYGEYVVGRDGDRYEDVVFAGDNVVAVDCERNLALVSDLKTIIGIIELPQDFIGLKKWAFRIITMIDNRVLLLPQNGNRILFLDLDNLKARTVFAEILLDGTFDENEKPISEAFDGSVLVKNNIYSFSTFENAWRIFDLKKEATAIFDCTSEILPEIEKEIDDTIADELMNGIVHEGGYFTLKNFIQKTINA